MLKCAVVHQKHNQWSYYWLFHGKMRPSCSQQKLKERQSISSGSMCTEELKLMRHACTASTCTNQRHELSSLSTRSVAGARRWTDSMGGCGLPGKASQGSRPHPSLQQNLRACSDAVRPGVREIGALAWELPGVGWWRELLWGGGGTEKAVGVRAPLGRDSGNEEVPTDCGLKF